MIRQSPPEAQGILSFRSANEAQICPFMLSFKVTAQIHFLKEYCCISVRSHYTVTKSGGSVAWKHWSLKSGGFEPDSLIEVYACRN